MRGDTPPARGRILLLRLRRSNARRLSMAIAVQRAACTITLSDPVGEIDESSRTIALTAGGRDKNRSHI